ncbi:MAG: zinc ribbon domain-containing protein [Lachnospiraceae bacterium]|nr:zinc ribbon domain-containing protein [Lachnospiraceae bacterium]
MGFCYNCGYQLDDEIKFCPRCGAQVIKPNTLIDNGVGNSLHQMYKLGSYDNNSFEIGKTNSDVVKTENNNFNASNPNGIKTHKIDYISANESKKGDGLKHIPYTPKKKGFFLSDVSIFRDTPVVGIALLALALVVLLMDTSILSFVLSLAVVIAAIICIKKNAKWKIISYISIVLSIICIVFNAVIVGSNVFIILFGEDPLNMTSVYFNKKNGIEEALVYDNNGVRITTQQIKYNNHEIQLELLFENTGSESKQITAGTAGCPLNAINGFMIPGGYINCELYPGQESVEVASYSYQELMLAGVKRISEIDMAFEIDGENGSLYTEPILIKTKSGNRHRQKKSGYSKALNNKVLQGAYGYSVNYMSTKEIYNENGISIISETLMTNKDGERTLLLEVRNNTESVIGVRSRDIKLNGSMAYEYMWDGTGVLPGCTGVMSLSLDNIIEYGEWTGNKDDIKDIEVTIEVRDSNGNDIGIPTEVRIDLK